MSQPLRPLALSLLCSLALLAPSAQAALLALEDASLSQISGQAGISIRLDLMARIDEIRWQDDGGSLSLRNVKIDNGDCPRRFRSPSCSQIVTALHVSRFGSASGGHFLHGRIDQHDRVAIVDRFDRRDPLRLGRLTLHRAGRSALDPARGFGHP